MSHPTRLDLFLKWSKAMVAGATVGKPNYSPALKTQRGSKKGLKGRKRFRRKRRHASFRKRKHQD